MQQPPASAPESFWRLLYRFFWPFQYFRDVTRGSKLERQQNYRHNRAMRGHLPAFIAKWVVLTAAWFVIGLLLEWLLDAALPAACCFVTASGSFVVVALLGVAWLWLERFPDLFEH